jgi:hypothetical protein
MMLSWQERHKQARHHADRIYPYRKPTPPWRADPEFVPTPFLLWLEQHCTRHHWERADLVLITGMDYNTVQSWTSAVQKLPDRAAIAALAHKTKMDAEELARIVNDSRVERAAGSEEDLDVLRDRLIALARQDIAGFFAALSPNVRIGLIRFLQAHVLDYPPA